MEQSVSQPASRRVMVPHEIVFQIRLGGEIIEFKQCISGPISHVFFQTVKHYRLVAQIELVGEEFQPFVVVEVRQIADAKKTQKS